MPDRQYEIHLHHVGGFAGAISLAVPQPLRGDVNLYLYDANAKAMDHIDPNTDYRRQTTLGKAVFDREGEVEVHLNNHPAASSLFPMAKAHRVYWADAYAESDMCDVLLSEQREIGSARVACTTIDALVRGGDIGIDFLSIDAEGSEKYILEGARDALTKRVVGLICEVHFAEVFTGQTKPGELFAKADAAGFHLADLQMHGGVSLRRLPVGWRANGAVMSGDAFFLKRIDAIKSDHPAPAISLLKLALFSLLTSKLEHGIAAADAAVAADPEVLTRGSDFAYVRLIGEMLDLYRKEQAIFLPTWSDYYPTPEAGLRHGDAGRGIDAREACRRYFARVNPVTFVQRINELSDQKDSPLEALLIRYGLQPLAVRVKQHRNQSMNILLYWLGLLEKDQPSTAVTVAQRLTKNLA